MIFTIMVIALLSFFLIAYSGYEIIKDRSPIEKRINTLNSFVSSVETDIPRHLYISGYRTIFIMQQYTIDKYSYITDFDNSLEEIFFNGTLYGEHKSLMDDGKFSDILESLNNNAEKINAEVQMLNPSISVEQLDPWNLQFNLNITLIITDKSNLASWNRTDSFNATVPIATFVDPIYSVETSGKVTNEITKSPFANFSSTDYSNLISHFQNSYYIASTSAPSFLNRLVGNFSNNEFGIESIVYPQNLANVDLSVKHKSLIDYIYFSDNNFQNYEISPISNLILDNQNNHLEIYNVTSVAVPI